MISGYLHHHQLPLWPGVILGVAGGLTVAVLVPLRYRRTSLNIRAGRTPLSRAMVPGTALIMVVTILWIGAEVFVGQ